MVRRDKVLNIIKSNGFYSAHIETENGFAAIPNDLINEVKVGDEVTIFSDEALTCGGFGAVVIGTPTISSITLIGEKNMREYWVSAIIQNDSDNKAWLLSMTDSVPSLERAIEAINRTKVTHRVLSAWVDIFDDSNNKHTVFHECYVNIVGNVNR